jgi:acetyltransferase-like isoleucine patch superfamily enzyme
VGDDVLIDGKCHFLSAARFADRPTLDLGDRTYVGHDCQFSIWRRITIGRDCLIAARVSLFDSDGHSADPAARLAGLPPRGELEADRPGGQRLGRYRGHDPQGGHDRRGVGRGRLRRGDPRHPARRPRRGQPRAHRQAPGRPLGGPPPGSSRVGLLI